MSEPEGPNQRTNQQNTQDVELYQAVKLFDRCLKKEYLARLSLEEAALLLLKIERFQSMVAKHFPLPDEAQFPPGWGLNPPPAYHTEYLMVVGCRLCSDLTEQIMLRLVDVLQSRENEADQIYIQLRNNMRDRQLASGLIQKSQRIRNLTIDNAESIGLGVIL
jgi:hypothetical protein